MRNPLAVFCSICGIFLPNQSFGSTPHLCKSQFCRDLEFRDSAAEIQKIRELNRAKRLKELESLARERAQHLRPELREKDSLKIIVLPFLEHNLKPPSIERKQRVEAGFLEVAFTAYASEQRLNPQSETNNGESLTDLPDQTSLTHTNDEQLENRFARLSGSACGTCGGRCCIQGGDRAFLNIEKFLEIFRSRPEATPEGVVAEYMDRIPGESFEGSCIFHGINGCSLAREQRTGICNRYLCPSLIVLRRDCVGERSSKYVLAATNLIDVEDPELKVFRIKIADELEETMLESAANDRISVGE